MVGHCRRKGGWSRFGNGEGPLPKGLDLRFDAHTDVTGPFNMFWQVVNTNAEAKHVGGLRGGIFRAANAADDGLSRQESTSYTGLHWIECFIVQRSVCVARSGEYLVHIA